MLVPVIGLVQVGWQGRADRYTYLPQIGLYIAATWTVADLTRLWRHQRIILSAAGLLTIVVLSWRAWVQTRYWRDSETLFKHALAVTTNNDVAENNLGIVYLRKGNLDEGIALPTTTLPTLFFNNDTFPTRSFTTGSYSSYSPRTLKSITLSERFSFSRGGSERVSKNGRRSWRFNPTTETR